MTDKIEYEPIVSEEQYWKLYEAWKSKINHTLTKFHLIKHPTEFIQDFLSLMAEGRDRQLISVQDYNNIISDFNQKLYEAQNTPTKDKLYKSLKKLRSGWFT